jgi:putative transposase
MGRLPRPKPGGDDSLTFHALNRGNNRADVFSDDGDRLAYLDALAKAKERYPFRLFGYCLMTNHVHLVLRPEPGQSISRIMQSVTVAHTWRHHRQHKSSGHVWQGRFKSPVVEDGPYFLAVLAYVESNPLRAGIVSDPADYRWSSYPGRMGLTSDPLLDDFPEWAELGASEASRRTAWRRRVAARPKRGALEAIRAAGVSGRPLGSEEWCTATAARIGLPDWPPRPRGRPRKTEN